MNKRKNLPAGRQVNKIHFTGIKGVGMTPLAVIAKEAGFEVTGSDVPDVFITDEELKRASIKVYKGFSVENVKDIDLVISTAAHGGLDNIEVKEAKRQKIKVLTQAEALGEFQKGKIFGKNFTGISVAGSHGKTTTSAIIATIFSQNGLNPSYSIGTGKIPSLNSSGHFGSGKYFIAEADEYFTDLKYKRIPKFYYQHPKYLIITNIDFDHPDVFPSIDEIEKAFLKFSENLTDGGKIIICGDGGKNRNFINKFKGKIVTYGYSSNNDYVLSSVDIKNGKTSFSVKTKNNEVIDYSIKVIGKHNALNALASIIVSQGIGLTPDQIKKGLNKFRGTKRRQEYKGKIDENILIYDDYAHHPEEIKQTLESFKLNYPNYKIISIFQSHTYSRTVKLFDDFVDSFEYADEVIIMDVFGSFREKNESDIISKKLSDKLKEKGKKSVYFPNITDVVKYISSINVGTPTVLITMGAGDVYKVGEELLENG